jgi:hypothetical protein
MSVLPLLPTSTRLPRQENMSPLQLLSADIKNRVAGVGATRALLGSAPVDAWRYFFLLKGGNNGSS